MLFEKEKYYKYINQIEKSITVTYIIIVGIFMIIGLALANMISFILMTLIGFLISSMYTLGAKIKIQKMRWEIDIHNKINSTKDKNE